MFATQGAALIIEIVIGIFTILSGIGYGIKWMVKHYLQELRPNGGSSLKDTVNRLEKDMALIKDNMLREEREQDQMQKKLDKMYDILLDYIANK